MLQARRALRRLRRDRRPGHGRRDARRHGRSGPAASPARSPARSSTTRCSRGGPRRHRDPRDAPRARARRLGDHPRPQARMSRRRAPAQRPPDAVPALGGQPVVAVRRSTSTRDAEQWRSSTTSRARAPALRARLADGRRGAHHHQVLRPGRRARLRGGGDLPRHPAGRRGAPHAVLRALPGRGRRRPGRHRRARASAPARASRDAFRHIFDVALVQAHEQLVAAPADLAAKVRFITLYHLVLEATLGLTTFKFVDRLPRRENAAARASSRATR